jgi:TolB protein
MLNPRVRRVTVFGLLLLAAFQAEAQLEIEITEYAGKQTPVAVVPFGWEGQEPTAPFDITAVIAADLRRSGRFAPIPEGDMLQKPTAGIDLDFDDWSILAVEAVVIGKLTQTGANAYSVQFQLFGSTCSKASNSLATGCQPVAAPCDASRIAQPI